MRVTIKGPQSVRGELKAPGSKAYTHRALIASLLTPGETMIQGALDCDDTRRTLEGIRLLGASVSLEKGLIISRGPENLTPLKTRINCGESGATLRFLTAVASTSAKQTVLTANGGLANRPMDPLLKALNELGTASTVTWNGHELALQVRGPIKGGETSLPGDISSQFLSGLLLAAPLSRSDVAINLNGEMESRPYVDMTIAVLQKHGIKVESTDRQVRVPAPQQYKPAFHQVDGDFSSAAFLMATAATAGESITILGLSRNNLEPDSSIMDVGPQIGLKIRKRGEAIVVEKSELRGFQFDATNNPDLVPALEVLACVADGSSEISGVRRLRFKETNRLMTLPSELTKMGARIHVGDDKVRIEHADRLSGAVLESHLDHRVAMACSAAAVCAHGESVLENAQVVSKSYPDFFNDLTNLGVEIRVE